MSQALGRTFDAWRSGAQQSQVSNGLNEVVRVVGAERGFVGGQRAGHGFDLANQHTPALRATPLQRGMIDDELVEATREREVPPVVNVAERQRHLEGGVGFDARSRRGGNLLFDLGPKLDVPLLAKLRTPHSRRPALAGITRPEREAGEFADAQCASAVIKGELHA